MQCGVMCQESRVRYARHDETLYIPEVVAVSPTFSLSLPVATSVEDLKEDSGFTLALCAGFVDAMNTMLSMVRATNSTTPTTARLSNKHCRVVDVRAARRRMRALREGAAMMAGAAHEGDGETAEESSIVVSSGGGAGVLSEGAGDSEDELSEDEISPPVEILLDEDHKRMKSSGRFHRRLQTVSSSVIVDFEFVLVDFPGAGDANAVPASSSAGSFSSVAWDGNRLSASDRFQTGVRPVSCRMHSPCHGPSSPPCTVHVTMSPPPCTEVPLLPHAQSLFSPIMHSLDRIDESSLKVVRRW